MKHAKTDGNGCNARYPVLLYVEGSALVFGGGEVGLRKASSLALHGITVTVVDKKDISLPDDMTLVRAAVTDTNFMNYIEDDVSLVVCALDDPGLNDTIAAYCKKHSIHVNVATSRTSGTVTFPAVLDSGNDIVAFSSMATCPMCAYALKRYIMAELPNIDIFSDLMHTLYERGELDRSVVSGILHNKELRAIIRKGSYEKALSYIEGEYL